MNAYAGSASDDHGWAHNAHTDDCMDNWSEARRSTMTAATVEANHRLHMADVAAAQPIGELDVVFTTSTEPGARPMPVRDGAGRVRVGERDGRRVGWATLADIEWTDEMP